MNTPFAAETGEETHHNSSDHGLAEIKVKSVVSDLLALSLSCAGERMPKS
jgi:hypothetical protein